VPTAQRGYAELLNKVCQPGGTQGQVDVMIHDSANKPIPGIRVQLVQADAKPEVTPTVVHSTTNAAGRASLTSQGNRYYTLLAGPIGFVPEARILFLPAGCTGQLELRLMVLEVEGLS
jgi:hypothetical protein